jgi:hypothetical protein
MVPSQNWCTKYGIGCYLECTQDKSYSFMHFGLMVDEMVEM